MTRRGFALAALAIAALLDLRAAGAEELLKIAVPQRGAWDTGVTELGSRAGIFKKHGLTLEILYTQAGPESIQSVISGSVDIATASGVSGALGTYAKGAPIRIIGSEMIGSPDLYWYVVPNSPIKTVADLNGKTIGFSQAGSSSHTGLLELIKQHKLDVKPVALGGMQATMTSTMTGQVDVGWGAAPFGLDAVADGKIRIVARGSDVAVLGDRTARVNVTSVMVLEKRKDAIDRFMKAYRETVDWMYDDPAALTHYMEFSKLPDSVVQQVRGFIPKASMSPDRIAGMDSIIAEAIKNKFIAAPLTPEQIKDMVQIPPR
jgi:NitT/TauT family transport system substrate-binding protein